MITTTNIANTIANLRVDGWRMIGEWRDSGTGHGDWYYTVPRSSLRKAVADGTVTTVCGRLNGALVLWAKIAKYQRVKSPKFHSRNHAAEKEG